MEKEKEIADPRFLSSSCAIQLFVAQRTDSEAEHGKRNGRVKVTRREAGTV